MPVEFLFIKYKLNGKNSISLLCKNSPDSNPEISLWTPYFGCCFKMKFCNSYNNFFKIKLDEIKSFSN